VVAEEHFCEIFRVGHSLRGAVHGLGLGFWFGVWGFGFGVSGLGFRVSGFGFGV